MAGAAATLWTPLIDTRTIFAEELNAASASVSPGVWHGIVKPSGANVRSGPSPNAAKVADLPPGTSVDVDKWIAGAEVYPTFFTWARLADGSGYIYATALQSQSTPYILPSEMAGMTGNWIDVNLTQNVIAAVQGQTIKNVFSTSPGRPGFETVRGLHHVLYQLPSDDMKGPGYYVKGVRWVSYFLPDGSAIHARTWDVDAISFGVPSSHGCLGVQLDAAAELYQFVSPGMAINIHD